MSQRKPCVARKQSKNKNLVITIGGANLERVLLPRKFERGSKHQIDVAEYTSGGSSLNHSCRLLAMGTEVFPILPVVKDSYGEILVQSLGVAARQGGREFDQNDKEFYVREDSGTRSQAKLITAFSTIVSFGAERTTFTEFPTSLICAFPSHYAKRILALEKRKRAPGAVMIGHVHADQKDSPAGPPGDITQRVINRFGGNTPIFMNLGGSQYDLGASFWQHWLGRVKCLQLDIDEVRVFCKDHPDFRSMGRGDPKSLTLENILNWFSDKCTVIITLERLGAVARRKGSKQVVLAWPCKMDEKEIIDTTGAGDALGASIVHSSLRKDIETSDENLCRALQEAQFWGAKACTTRGGADNCPDQDDLAEFKATHSLLREAELLPMEQAGFILSVLDRAFPRKDKTAR